MDHVEFGELHYRCVVAKELYAFQIEKTIAMLAKITSEPLPLEDRLNLLTQEVRESEAHDAYMGAKRVLHYLAKLGYGFST